MLERLEQIEISLVVITAQLQDERVNAFIDSYDQLLEVIRQKETEIGVLAASD
ncbi:MAG TPA: hypothetical protein VF897_00200 [Roseiflexaceae bacterium]